MCQTNVHNLLAETGDEGYSTFIRILESLKKETLTIQHEKDLQFFVNAMEMASRQFCDRRAGEMVNELLLTNENYMFIGNNIRVSVLNPQYIVFCLKKHYILFFVINNKIYKT